MAGDWLKWCKGLARRLEVLTMARRLKLDRRLVAAACMEVWEWADDNTTDGKVPGLELEEIDRLTGIKGFASAMASVGWVAVLSGSQPDRNGIEFPRWGRHNGESSKARAQDAERKRRSRSDNAVLSGSQPDAPRTEIGLQTEQRRLDGSDQPVAIAEGGTETDTVLDVLTRLQVGEPCRSQLAACPNVTIAEIREAWPRIVQNRKVKDPAAVLVAELKKRHGILVLNGTHIAAPTTEEAARARRFAALRRNKA